MKNNHDVLFFFPSMWNNLRIGKWISLRLPKNPHNGLPEVHCGWFEWWKVGNVFFIDWP